jgi:hypothetical protein
MTKNLRGKTVKRENAYEVWRRGSWTWYVLKHYQSTEAEEKNPYARVFCLVITPMTGELGDLGDTYLRDIKSAARLVGFRDMEGETAPAGSHVVVGLAPDGQLGDSFAVA